MASTSQTSLLMWSITDFNDQSRFTFTDCQEVCKCLSVIFTISLSWMLHHKSYPWGTLREDCTSRLSHLGFFSSHLTVIISENLFLSFFRFTFIPNILLSFISSQLTTWFCHNSQKTSMPRYERVTAFVNLINVTMISKVLNLHNGICLIKVVPTETWVHNSIF